MSRLRADVLAYIGLGGNLGDATATVRAAMKQIVALPQTRMVATSSLYRTAPIDATGPDFVNAVVGVHTRLDAHELLLALQGIETLAGRERPYLNAPRTLDLDVLLFGEGHIHSPQLVVPHPRMWQRAFVLLPLAEIAPERVSAAQLVAVAAQRIERLPSGPNQAN